MAETRTVLEAINKEIVDLEKIPVEEVLRKLQCSRKGLSADEAQKRLVPLEHNKLEEKKENKICKFLGLMWDPFSWVMEAAAVMSIAVALAGSGGTDFPVFVGIFVLLIINSTIIFMEENNARNAAATSLERQLTPKAKVLRNGKWKEEDASVLVPGDIISIKLGDTVPADARLLEGDPLKIDQPAVTGESLPVTKNPGDAVYSGSTCMQGEMEAVVIATGVNTLIGKATRLLENTSHDGHFQKVLTATSNFCICLIATAMVVEIVVTYGVQRRGFRVGIENLLVLLIGGIPIAAPTVLAVTMAVGSHRLLKQGAVIKRTTTIWAMAGMDVLCCNKTGTLTLNKLSIDKSMIKVFPKDVDKDMVILLAARASRLENQDSIDTAIVSMLANPNEARAGITEVDFMPFSPTDQRTTLAYLDGDGKMYRVSKGSPKQIVELVWNKSEIKQKVFSTIDKFAKKGLRALGVARQEVPDGTKDSPGGPWEFVGILPLFDPPHHDSADTIKRASDRGVNIKMITDDKLEIAKETGRQLGMGTDMYLSSSLLGEIQVDELIEKADGFAEIFPEHKHEIVKKLQAQKHVVGMTGNGVTDAPALKIANIGIAVADSTDAARSASDIVLQEPGLNVIISAVLTCRSFLQRMKGCTIYAVSSTTYIVMVFTLLTLIWNFDFPPFMVLITAILNYGTMMTIPRDRVKPSPLPEPCKLSEIFATGVAIGGYLATMTVLFFWGIHKTEFFSIRFGVQSLRKNAQLTSAVFLQVSTISQALILVTRSWGLSLMERPGLLSLVILIIAQLIVTMISETATWDFAGVHVEGIGWHWTGVIWLMNGVIYLGLDLIKIVVRIAVNGKDSEEDWQSYLLEHLKLIFNFIGG